VIDDDVLALADGQRVALAGLAIAGPAAEMADDRIVRGDVELVVGETDTVTRRSLAGDGDERLLDQQLSFELDRAGDAEDDGARPFRFDRRAEAAGAGVVEVIDE
jgi:hypothetical protein